MRHFQMSQGQSYHKTALYTRSVWTFKDQTNVILNLLRWLLFETFSISSPPMSTATAMAPARRMRASNQQNIFLTSKNNKISVFLTIFLEDFLKKKRIYNEKLILLIGIIMLIFAISFANISWSLYLQALDSGSCFVTYSFSPLNSTFVT